MASHTIIDAILRREVFLQRFASHLINTQIDGTIQSFARSLPSLLSQFGDAAGLTLSERRIIARAVNVEMSKVWTSMWADITDQLNSMAILDAKHIAGIYNEFLGVALSLPANSILLGHIAQSIMVLTSGKTTKAGVWSKFLRDNINAATRQINGAIWSGYTSNLSNDQIGQNIRGIYNRATKQYQGGLLSGITRAQSEALVRTGISHFANGARDRTYAANIDIIQSRILIATLDNRTTFICMGRNLREWDITDNSYPRLPFHFNCLLPDTVITSSLPIASVSKRAFKGEVINIITESGNSLTVTPNHPILSNEGWVSAKLLTVGNNVFSHSDSEPVLTWDGRNNYIDSTIEDIFESLIITGSMSTRKVPLTAPDFHSDTKNGEVAVILSDVKLSNVLNGLIIQEFSKEILVNRCPDVSSFISRFSHFIKNFITNRFPGVELSGSFTDSLSGFITEHSSVDFILFCERPDLDPVFYHETFAHHSVKPESFTDIRDSIAFIIKLSNFIKMRIIHNAGSECALFTAASYIDSVFREDFLNSGCTISSKLANCHDTESAVIRTDNIIEIKRFHYDGPVYNLETVGGIYSANNIVNHNCRSVYIVRLIGDDDPLEGTKPAVGGISHDADDFKTKFRGKRDLDVYGIKQVAADTTTDDFLRRQPDAFIISTLGKARAELFINKKFSVKRFTDMTGRVLTLDELGISGI